MKALVTGGAGFIGSHIVDALLARGDQVVVVDDLSTGREQNLLEARERGAVLEVLDIRDGGEVDRVFAAHTPEVVFHLAAQADVRRSIDDPAFDATVNVVGTITVLEAARRHGARRLVNTSTGGAIYGTDVAYPTPETAEAAPMAAYGQSKQCAEQYCAWERRLHGFEAVTLRYGNVYGPRQNPDADAGVIAIFCGLALTKPDARPKVFGDGRQTRDYIYVGDVVAANVLAAEHPDAVGPYNIGTETERTVLDIVEAIRALLDPERAAAFEPDLHPARFGELQRSSLDAGKVRRELGFSTQVSLEDGIRRTFEANRVALTGAA